MACNFLTKYRDGKSKGWTKFTATQFAEVWNHYDSDGNGFIEDHELDAFLKELIHVVSDNKDNLSDEDAVAFKKEFMDNYDKNADNKIDIAELAHLLPMDENFLLIFRRESPLDSSIEFMHIWKSYDTDKSGYIESTELKSFITDMFKAAKQEYTAEKIEEYTNTMLQLFDANHDGKLQLSELARLLPVKNNYLSEALFKNADQIKNEDIDRIFKNYDVDNSGTIENDELSGFLKDIMELIGEEYTDGQLDHFKSIILEQWDVNHDGKIDESELKMILGQQSRLSALARA